MRIINIIEQNSGIIAGIESFGIWEEQTSQDVVNKAEEYFGKLMLENNESLLPEDIEIALEDGNYDDNNGWEINIVWSEIN